MTAVLPPAALKGPCLVLRPADTTVMSMGDLVASGTLNPKARRLLEAAVRSHRSIVVCGARGSGRTTVLSALASLAPENHRVVVLEESPELNLQTQHVVPLSAAKAGDVEELVDALGILRPDLIVLGDLLGTETLPALRLMTGGVCVLTCVHGSSALDALVRIEALAYLAGGELTPTAIRGLIAAAVDLVVEVARLEDGSRHVMRIVEPLPVGQDGVPRVATLMRSAAGGSGGLQVIGVEPSFVQDLRAAGFVDLTPEFFGVNPDASAVQPEATPARPCARGPGHRAGGDGAVRDAGAGEAGDRQSAATPGPGAATIRHRRLRR